jgi:hypothetical protein
VTLSEVRLYDGKRELQRAPAWRVRARRSVDRATRLRWLGTTQWRSNQSLFAGMSVEVNIGAPQSGSRWAQSSAVEQNSRVRSGDGGPRVALAEQPAIREMPPPLGLRRAA